VAFKILTNFPNPKLICWEHWNLFLRLRLEPMVSVVEPLGFEIYFVF